MSGLGTARTQAAVPGSGVLEAPLVTGDPELPAGARLCGGARTGPNRPRRARARQEGKTVF